MGLRTWLRQRICLHVNMVFADPDAGRGVIPVQRWQCDDCGLDRYMHIGSFPPCGEKIKQLEVRMSELETALADQSQQVASVVAGLGKLGADVGALGSALQTEIDQIKGALAGGGTSDAVTIETIRGNTAKLQTIADGLAALDTQIGNITETVAAIIPDAPPATEAPFKEGDTITFKDGTGWSGDFTVASVQVDAKTLFVVNTEGGDNVGPFSWLDVVTVNGVPFGSPEVSPAGAEGAQGAG